MSDADQTRTPPGASFVGIGVAIGVGAGTAIGVAIHNIAVGISIGVGLGSAFGLMMTAVQKKDDAKPPRGGAA